MAAVLTHLEIHRLDCPADERGLRLGRGIEAPYTTAAEGYVEVVVLVKGWEACRRGVLEGVSGERAARVGGVGVVADVLFRFSRQFLEGGLLGSS